MKSFNGRNRKVVESIVVMAKNLGIHSVSEGVETEEQVSFLKSIGCEIAQGYYFGVPVLLNDIRSGSKNINQEPERGDIVIFHYPVDEKKIYIKRIIGLPGETVRIEDGNIYIDDSTEPLQEGYLKEEWEVLNTGFEFHVPEGSYLMLGDNRNWSEDARYWADNALYEDLADSREEAEQYTYVRKEKILGKAIFTYFRKFRILQHGEWYE